MAELTRPKMPEKSVIQQLLSKQRDQSKPLDVFCELTYRCNLDCVHCYCIRGAGRDELTTQQWKDFLLHSSEEGAMFCAFSGGEILVRQDFFELFAYARSLNYVVKLKTNGTLITPEIADKIAAGMPNNVDISMLGGGAQVHERMTRVRQSYDKAWEGIRLLRERGVQVKINSSLMKDNFEEYDILTTKAKGLGCATNCDVQIHARNDGDTNVQQYEMDKTELREFTKDLPITSVGPKVLPDPDRQLMCNAGRGSFSINPYGDITTCNPLQVPLGNVTTDTWSEVRKSQFLKRILSMTLQDLPECKGCEYREYCSRCHASSWQETGNITLKSVHACKRAKMLKSLYNERLEQDQTGVKK